MELLADIIGHPLSGVAFIAFVGWLLYRSPLLAWTTLVLLLIAWGFGSVGATLYVILGIYLPDGDYLSAALALLAGTTIIVPWAFIGFPKIVRMNRTGTTGLKAWT